MKRFNLVRRALTVVALGFLAASPTWGQIDEMYKDYREVYRDTVTAKPQSRILVQRDTLLDPNRVVTNSFGKNWFVYATGGAHTFRGDYSRDDKFKGTVSPDWGVGIGKWFTPGLALKMEFIRTNSRGYTEYMSQHYGYGPVLGNYKGNDYRAMKTKWWDISALASLNLTRLILGYEGLDSNKRMGQWMVNLGIGGVHHMGFANDYGSDNLWSGHAELQYSQFFNPKKKVSLDLKARGLFYQTNFDHESGMENRVARKFDSNLGLHAGLTFYLGKARNNGWGTGTTRIYQQDYREREIQVLKIKEQEVAKRTGNHGTLTFFVFYPNNYSGRNDAPLIAGASVNALDYLAGGIFTSKRYVDNDAVAARLKSGASLNGLEVEDLKTERADKNFEINYVPRGYEMLEGTPMSLSLKADDMAAFREKAGFYYAPIYDGLHVWNYRIDDATLRQQLVSGDNYLETNSFGLNSHYGLGTVRQYMDVDDADELVSFADIYAALNSNNGYVSQFADAKTVAKIRGIVDRGIMTLIQVEGLATSQDNYSGQDAQRVGRERNTALSQNRAATVIQWLNDKDGFRDVASQIFLVDSLNNGIRTVTDKSTRGLNAKLNRCVKVRIQYMID